MNKDDQEEEIDDNFLNHFLKVSKDAESWMTGTHRHFTLFAKTFLRIKEEKETFILDNERKFEVLFSDFLTKSTPEMSIFLHSDDLRFLPL